MEEKGVFVQGHKNDMFYSSLHLRDVYLLDPDIDSDIYRDLGITQTGSLLHFFDVR